MAASIVLLVGASLVLRSMLKLTEVNPGSTRAMCLMMEVISTYNADESAQTRVDRFSRLLQRLSEMPESKRSVRTTAALRAATPWNRAEFTAEHQSLDEQTIIPRELPDGQRRLFSDRPDSTLARTLLTRATNWMRRAFCLIMRV